MKKKKTNKTGSNILDLIDATVGTFYKDYVHPGEPDYDDEVCNWNIRGSHPGEIEHFIITAVQGAYSQGFQDGAERIQKDTIKEILHDIIKNGSTDRETMIIELTKRYKKLTGIDIPKKYERKKI